jgi:hypothetical protein
MIFTVCDARSNAVQLAKDGNNNMFYIILFIIL